MQTRVAWPPLPCAPGAGYRDSMRGRRAFRSGAVAIDRVDTGSSEFHLLFQSRVASHVASETMPRRLMRTMVMVMVAGSVVLFSLPTRADESVASQAEASIREGVRLRQEGNDERALPFFQKAYDLLHTPRTEGQLGLVEMAIGYWLEADQHLAEALESPEHPWVIKNRDALQGALTRVKHSIGEIVLSGGPPGATIFLNGRPVGRMPMAAPIRAPKGKAEIELRAPGYATGSYALRIAGSDSQALTVNLEKQSLAPASTAPAARNQPASIPVATPALNPADAFPSTPRGDEASTGTNFRRGLAWGSAAAAGGAIAFGIFETIAWQRKRSEFSNHRAIAASGSTPGAYDCFEDASQRGGAGCATLYDAAHGAQVLAIVGYAVGGGLALASALLFWNHEQHALAGAHAFGCAPTLARAGIACGVSF
jgi:PEGA domain